MFDNKKESKIVSNKDNIAFLVGCFATFYVSLVGRVYVGELIIFLYYIFKKETRASLPPCVKKLTKLMWLWLVSAIITDLYRQTPIIDMIKGLTSQLFLISLVPFAYWVLHDKLSRWFYFYIGTIVSSQLTYYFLTSQTEFGSTEIWRTYSYLPLMVGCSIISYWKGHHNFSFVVLLAVGVWILFGGSRNAFLICCMSVVVLYYIDKLNCQNIISNIYAYQKKMVVLVFSMMIGVFAFTSFYETLAENGSLGEKAQEKYYKQKNSSAGLASGRLEAIMDVDLISKSPIIGYGSFAKDKENYVYKYYVEHNVDFNPAMFDRDIDSVENMLPRHSRFFGMWMWHGIGAGIFWIFIIYLFIKTLRNGSLLLYPKLLCLSIYTMFTELWNNFFSIMSDRITPIFLWIFLILVNEEYKQICKSR